MEVQDSLFSTVLDGVLATTDEGKAFDGAQVREHWVRIVRSFRVYFTCSGVVRYATTRVHLHVCRFVVVDVFFVCFVGHPSSWELLEPVL